MRLPLLVCLLALTACGTEPAPTAAPSPAPTPVVSGLQSFVPLPLPSADGTVRLTGDGVEVPTGVVVFGDAFAQAEPQLLRFLGPPSKDLPPVQVAEVYGPCPAEDARVLEFAGGALQLHVGTRQGAGMPSLLGWRLTAPSPAAGSAAAPRASALVGDVATFEFGPGTTVAELREGAGEALMVLPADELTRAGFALGDQSGGFTGRLSSSDQTGVVQDVQAGSPCGGE